MNKYNIIVNSKNKLQNDTNSKLTVNLPYDLIAKDNEYFTINISSFDMIKSFYSVQKGLNNTFDIVLKRKIPIEGLDNDISYNVEIDEGNYNVLTLTDEIKNKTLGLIDLIYIKKLNKFRFIRESVPITGGTEDINDFDFYIKPNNFGIFLGLNNNEDFLIEEDEETFCYSTNTINVAGYTTMMIKIGGDVSIENSIINLSSQSYEPSKVLAVINLQPFMPMDSITFNSKNETNNVYKVHNKKISSFTLEIVNEDNVIFPQMSDFIINLAIERIEQNETTKITKKIFERLNDLIFYVLYFLQRFGISPTDS